MEIRSSGGSLDIGDCLCCCSRSMLMLISRRFVTPIEDWESFACAMKKSVSSSSVRSGELAESSDSDGLRLGILVGGCGLDIVGLV